VEEAEENVLMQQLSQYMTNYSMGTLFSGQNTSGRLLDTLF
jgi:hypothetical protein